MAERFEQLRDRLEDLEREVEALLAQRRKAFKFTLVDRKPVFEKGVAEAHAKLRKSAARSIAEAYLRNLIAAPFIYALVGPLIVLDAFASLYQAIGFRVWRIPRVARRDFVVLDRGALAYLNWIQKLNCVYCGYANGVLAYAHEIASRTEQYWCPIKHAIRVRNPHKRYYGFIDYGDADAFEAKVQALRERLRSET